MVAAVTVPPAADATAAGATGTAEINNGIPRRSAAVDAAVCRDQPVSRLLSALAVSRKLLGSDDDLSMFLM